MNEAEDNSYTRVLREQTLIHQINLVTRWTKSLEREIEEGKTRLLRLKPADEKYGIGDRLRLKLSQDISLHDLIRRGLDPKKPRHFKGRIELIVRCQPRGHILGNVYPTTLHPVLVPTVSALPLNRERRKTSHQRDQEHESLQALLFKIDSGMSDDEALARTRAISNRRRDVWIEEHTDERAPEGTPGIGYIRGLEVLGDDFFQPRDAGPDLRKELGLAPDESVDVAMYLYCRCGERYLRLNPLAGALEKKLKVLTV